MSQNNYRRDFLITSVKTLGVAGGAISIYPILDSWNPDSGVMASATKEVNITNISKGSTTKVVWQGKPVFIRNRTDDEIKQANSVDLTQLKDPETDAQRTKPGKENWLVVVGVCTHLGCIPLGQSDGSFFCPCHGSYYDTSGRIVKGPAPKNLHVPEYSFVNDSTILIGKPNEKDEA